MSVRKEVVVMEVVHSRCAGMDVSKKDAKVCVRVAGAGRRKTVETVVRGQVPRGAVLIIVGLLVGPGGGSLFTT
jgi:hypothetical protein